MKNINIIHQNIDSRYTVFFKRLYAKEKNINYFMSDIKLSIDYCLATKDITTITLSDADKLLGHCSIIKAKDSNKRDVAYFGFFESPENEVDFTLFLKNIIIEAKKQNIKKLIGPINGSIWFPYRFIHASHSPYFFKGELPATGFYHDYFSKLENKKIITYSSGIRKNFDLILEATKKSYQKLQNTDFTIETLSEVSEQTLREIHKLAEEVFSHQSVAYEHLPSSYFLQLYNKDKMKDLFRTYIVKKGGELIGFCNVFYEEEKIIILKTLAIHPLFQKHGIGSAISYLVHMDAKESKVETIIYALVRDDNNIKFFPKDDVISIRTYSLFEIEI
jgi:predicted GNAT family acetyltransferase